jgi:hypothetical protein
MKIALACVLLASTARADISVIEGGGAARFLKALARGSIPQLRALTAWPFAVTGVCTDEKSRDALLACLVRVERKAARQVLGGEESRHASVAELRDQTRSNGYLYEPLEALTGPHHFVLRHSFDNQEWVAYRLAIAVRADGRVDGLADLSYMPPDI